MSRPVGRERGGSPKYGAVPCAPGTMSEERGGHR
jgi:hypothetical protein